MMRLFRIPQSAFGEGRMFEHLTPEEVHQAVDRMVEEVLESAGVGVGPEKTRPMMGESLANLFAHRLLVPTRWLAGEARACGYDLPSLKERFRTASHEVIAWRLLDLSEPCVITIVDNDSVSRR